MSVEETWEGRAWKLKKLKRNEKPKRKIKRESREAEAGTKAQSINSREAEVETKDETEGPKLIDKIS